MPLIEEIKVTLTRPGRKQRVFRVPGALGDELERLLNKSALDNQTIRAETVLPELTDEKLRPAAMLRGSRYKTGLTQHQLTELLGIAQPHLSAMENGKRPIGKNMARKLAAIFHCDYRIFL